MRRVIPVGAVLIALTCVSVYAAPRTEHPQRAEAQTNAPDAAVKVDLNTADRAALQELPGIGVRTAELILEYRKQNGGFKKIEELMNIRGIGERTFLRLRPLVRVSVRQSSRD